MPHRKAAAHLDSSALKKADERFLGALVPEVERRHAEYVYSAPSVLSPALLPGEFFDERNRRHGNSLSVIGKPLRVEPEARDTGPALDFPHDALIVGADYHRNGASQKGDEFRLQAFCGFYNPVNQKAVVPENRIHMPQSRAENDGFRAHPARLVVPEVISRAARCVVEDNHAAKLEQGGSTARIIRRIRRKSDAQFAHTTIPALMMRSSAEFSCS